MNPTALTPRRLRLADLRLALIHGWRIFVRCRRFSLAYGAVFAIAGSLLIWGAQALGLAPMSVALAGGFLLVGPIAAAGLVGVAEAQRGGRPADLALLLAILRGTPRGLWALALFCVLVSFIWLTDAGTLYSFMIGGSRHGLGQALAPDTARFHLFSAATGFVLANGVYAVTAHAVPLMVRLDWPLVPAVSASVRAILASPLVHGAWALLLATAIFASLLLPPLLCVTLPVLAYAGSELNVQAFPPPGDAVAATPGMP